MSELGNRPLTIGVDIGTYESKGVVVDSEGSVVASARRTHDVLRPREGHVEHDAESTWWGGFVDLVRLLMDSPGVDIQRVAAVGCSGIGPCVLPVDGRLQPLRHAILYGVDTRAAAEIEILNNRLGEMQVIERSGNRLSSQSAGPKIAWLRFHEPDTHSRARYFLTCQSYVVAKLTGAVVMDHTTASYFHPLYDIRSQQWNINGCEDFITRDALPRLTWSSEVVGAVTAEAARATGLPVGLPVIAGTSDAPAEAVSAGIGAPGQLMVMYGSSSFMIEVVAAPARSSVLWTAPYVFPSTYCVAAGTSTAGTAVHWLADLLGTDGSSRDEIFGTLVRLAEGSPPGARGLVTVPSLNGERTPDHNGLARGVVAGLTLQHTRSDVVRSVFEGIAHSMVRAIRCFSDEGHEVDEDIVSVGGGTKNAVWLQAVSDISGNRQEVVSGLGACQGDATLAALGVGLLDSPSDIRQWVGPRTVVSPDPALSSMYRAQHEQFLALVQATGDMWRHGAPKDDPVASAS